MATTPGALSRAVVGLGKQSAYQTAVAASMWFPWETVGSFEPMRTVETYSDGYNVDDTYDALLRVNYAFNVTTQLRASNTGQLLEAVLGATDVATHVTGTMANTTTTGTNNAGSTSLTITSGTGSATGDVLKISQGTTTEFVVIASGGGTTTLTLKFPLMNSYTAGATVANATTSIYGHVGSAAQVQLPLFTMWHSMGQNGAVSAIDTVQVQDCIITDLTLTLEAGKHGTLQFAGVGTVGTPGQSVQTPTFSTDRSLNFLDSQYVFGSGLTVTGGAADVAKFQLTLKSQQFVTPVGGTVVPKVFSGKRTIDLAFDLYAEDSKPFRDVTYGGDANTTYASSDTVMTSMQASWLDTGSNHAVELLLNHVILKTSKPKFDVNGSPFTLSVTASPLLQASTAALAYQIVSGDTTAY